MTSPPASAVRNYADSHDVIPVSTKRFSASPWFDKYRTDRTVLGIYSGRLYPLSLGEDPIDDYWHLRRQVTCFDVPEHPIEIVGPDAVRLLDLLLTRNVSEIPEGRARYALACDESGGILMDGVLIRWSADRFWYVMADGDFLGWMRAHARGRDVEVRDPDVWVLQVQGPRALEVLHAAARGSSPDPFPYFAAATTIIGGQPVVVTRTGWTGELGFEVYAGPDIDRDALWNALMEAGAPCEMRISSLECMGIRRIEAGILDNGTDMDPSVTPFAAGLGAFVDLDKGDFVGRSALASAERGRRLFGISGDGTPVPGATIRRGGLDVGIVRAGAWSPSLGTGIGYALFDQPGDWTGEVVEVSGIPGGFSVIDGPFLDPQKRLARGLALDAESG